MRWAWLLFFSFSLQAQYLCPDNPCTNRCCDHCCTDDALGVYGNERILWDQLPGWDFRDCSDVFVDCVPEGLERCYEAVFWPTEELVFASCERATVVTDDDGNSSWVYQAARTSFNPYQVDSFFHPIEGVDYFYTVRGCLGKMDNPDKICGLYASPAVRVVGGIYACFDSQLGSCETLCWPSAPYRLTPMPTCP